MRVLLAASLLLLAPRAPGIAVDRCEATGPSSSSTIVHSYTLRLEIRLDGGRGVSPAKKLK